MGEAAGEPAPDETAPSGYAVAFTEASYQLTVDADDVDLDVTGAEVGAAWEVSVSSSGGGTPVTDSGTVASASFQIAGLDLSGLTAGTLTASLVLTDTALNEGSPATDTATLDAAPVTYETESTALFARFGTDPGTTRKGLIDTLIAGLKTDGLWAKIDAWWVLAAHDATDALLNWKSSSFTLTAVNSPTFTTDRGYAGNGSSSYLNTNWDPSTNGVQYALNSASAGIYLNAGTTAAAFVSAFGGEFGSSSRLKLQPNASSNTRVNINHSSTVNVGSVATRLGLSVVNRSLSNAVQVYRNGSSIGTSSETSGALSSVDISLLCHNQNGSRGEYMDNRVALFFVGASLDATEQANLNTHLSTFLTAIGAN